MIVWDKRRTVLCLIFVLNILVFPIVRANPKISIKTDQYNITRKLNSISEDSSLYYPVFIDNFSLVYWDLYDVSDRIIDTNAVPNEDSFTWKLNPNWNTGSSNDIWISDMGSDETTAFIKYIYPNYLSYNIVAPSILTTTEIASDDPAVKVYHTTYFDENTITWNNQPGRGTYQGTDTSFPTITLGNPWYYYRLEETGSAGNCYAFYSSESVYKPRVHHYFGKSYQGNGMIYMQTDEQETLNLRSSQYIEKTPILKGYIVNVTFQTTNRNLIVLKFFNDNAEVKQIIVSPNGNSNFIRQMVEVELNSNFEFDRLMFSGMFEDTQFFKCYNIDIIRSVLDQPDDADDPKELAKSEKKDHISDKNEPSSYFLISSVIGSTFIGVSMVALLSIVVVRRVQVINAKKKEWKWISDPDLINNLEK